MKPSCAFGQRCPCKEWTSQVRSCSSHLQARTVPTVGLRGGNPDFDLEEELAALGGVDISAVVKSGIRNKHSMSRMSPGMFVPE
eukprot:CAMPEP_0181292528 /NCGR_PEP_ID=MMETSP1101-20121128/2554_1 /TAXON_ID=46948 /ORGANISM="Rhodomonas abbreviata, Strain Caron Lab Isolate" /LENGTH=83 /DNA_ID=CAMNT_0023397003 /DNA_START=132 /DNA_END=383 /DNA_ORIENTATION=+